MAVTSGSNPLEFPGIWTASNAKLLEGQPCGESVAFRPRRAKIYHSLGADPFHRVLNFKLPPGKGRSLRAVRHLHCLLPPVAVPPAPANSLTASLKSTPIPTHTPPGRRGATIPYPQKSVQLGVSASSSVSDSLTPPKSPPKHPRPSPLPRLNSPLLPHVSPQESLPTPGQSQPG